MIRLIRRYMLAPSSYTHYLCSKEMREMRKLIVLMVFALLSVVTVKAINAFLVMFKTHPPTNHSPRLL